MKLINFKSIILFAALSAFMASCTGSNDSDLVTDQTLGNCLTYTVDEANMAQNFNRISFSAKYNYTNSTVDLSVSGLILPVAGGGNGVAIPLMMFKDMPWHYNDMGWKIVDVNNVYPEITGFATVPKFDRLEFALVDFFDENSYRPGILYKFDIDGQYHSCGSCMTGTTTSTDPVGTEYSPEDDGQTSNKPVYWMDFDFDNLKADIYIYNAKFLGGMPPLNLVFPGVDMTSSQGLISLSASQLIPIYNDVPWSSMPVNDLTGTFDLAKGLTLNFNCDFRSTLYKVKVDAKY